MDLRVNDQTLARGLNGRRLSRRLVRRGRCQTGAQPAVEKAATGQPPRTAPIGVMLRMMLRASRQANHYAYGEAAQKQPVSRWRANCARLPAQLQSAGRFCAGFAFGLASVGPYLSRWDTIQPARY